MEKEFLKSHERSQGRRNGFEHGGDSELHITFEPFVVQTSNLQFWKWQAESQNIVGTRPHVPICSGGPESCVLIVKCPVSIKCPVPNFQESLY